MVSEKIIEGCIKRQRKAQKKMYEACAPYVYSIIKNYVSDLEFRKDTMQEIFAHIFISLKNYKKEKGNFRSWISRIAVYKCIDVIKKNNRIKLEYGLELLNGVSDHSFQKMSQLNKQEIENMLAKMPIGYRTIFLLAVVDQYSHKEIGELLEISPETSRSQLSRAKGWIRRNLISSSQNLMYDAG